MHRISVVELPALSLPKEVASQSAFRSGIHHGKVIRVATNAIPEPDARQTEEMSSANLQTAVPFSNAQRMQNLVYPVVSEPAETSIVVDGKAVPLSPGMAVTIEVARQRRILEYLFSPLVDIVTDHRSLDDAGFAR